jgi:CheY-like chemotaxis protein
MDGYTATRKIREFDRDIIILAQTAYAFDSERQHAMTAGFDEYISKPFDSIKIIELTRKIIRKRG